MMNSLLGAAMTGTAQAMSGIVDLDSGLLDLISGADECGCCNNPQITTWTDNSGTTHNVADCG